jgi:hypothetical protein
VAEWLKAMVAKRRSAFRPSSFFLANARVSITSSNRRSFVLLCPIDDTSAQERMRDLVLQAYAEYEAAVTNTAS